MSGIFADKTIVVTGAAQGIGRAYAEEVAGHGGRVVLCDINLEAVTAAANDLKSRGLEATAHKVDVSSLEACRDFAADVEVAYGAVHGLINNAAVFSSLSLKPFWEIDSAEWDLVMSVNVRGTWAMVTALLPLLEKADAASVVNISSDAVWMGKPGYAHYVASKGAVYGMTHAMSKELGDKGIRVNSVSPGLVMTEVPRQTFTPEQRESILASQALQRFAGTDDIVDVVTFLLSGQSKWMTGQTLHVNGGSIHP
jgi:NAD(P)-dependent dehydrogenase (short-subunit alcohol dehydrogenase family)